jgi:hypothetical protein
MATGCGGGTKTVTVAGVPARTGQIGVHSETATASSTETAAQPPTRTVSLEAFQSPSGNIGCVVVSELARCDIAHRQWSAPARPATCPRIVDYGQGLEVGPSGPGRFVCAGDTAADPHSPRLPYGAASAVAGFVCVSASTGMTCSDLATHHGFFISVQSYKAF